MPANWQAPQLFGVRYIDIGRFFFQGALTFTVVLIAGYALSMYRQYRERERDAAELRAQAIALQAEQAELRAHSAQLQTHAAELQTQLANARLAVLRTRLNPHFLFNTLNAVSALVATDPRGVRDMIALLSELLRRALQDSASHEIQLSEELELLRLYLEILEIRYQGSLQCRILIRSDARDALVPNLILQPLVENAVKHAIELAGGAGVIDVFAYRAHECLVIAVRDTGPGTGGGSIGTDTGVGLRLTRERLAELYGDEQTLMLKRIGNGGMRARITLPYHTAAEVRELVAAGST
jgi:LytS/YehU family sensor histidine kinase